MKINSISISNFRLIRNFVHQINNNQIMIIGDNASGKTSIVEAIYYACFLSSFRAKHKQEMLSFNEQLANININYHREKDMNINIYITSDKQNIKVNNTVCNSRLEVIGNLSVLMLSPDFDEYVSGSPKIRRKFLNMHISQYDKEYSYYLSKYQSILKQRNALLKSAVMDEELLVVLTDTYDELIDIIRAKRKEFINLIEKYGKSIVTLLSLNQDDMRLEYKDSKRVDSAKERLFKKTLYGLQYDDFVIYIDDKEAKKYASQGQKRTISIALILSQLELIKKQIGEYPVVIIDDVHVELDSKRQQILFEILDKSIQTFFISASIDSIPIDKQKTAQVLYAEEKGVFVNKTQNN